MGYFFSGIILVATLTVSCSTTQKATQPKKGSDTTKNSESSSPAPGWYQSSQPVSSTPTAYVGFAAAIAADSSQALSKALRYSHANLESQISAKLESIRSEAVIELGSTSELDSPRFILVIRRAEREVSGVSEIENTKVEKNSAANGYRAFVQVKAEKEAIINELDRRFSGYAKAWNAMKNSTAFSKF